MPRLRTAIPFSLALLALNCAPPTIAAGVDIIRAFPAKAGGGGRPTLALALSGGAVRGLAHLGVLDVLDSAGLKPDAIAGTSMGALLGGLYALGMTPREIAARLENLDWSGIIFDEPPRKSLLLARKEEHSRHLLTLRLNRKLSPVVPGAVSPGQQLYLNLLELTHRAPRRSVGDWDDLPVKLRIIATDLQTGSRFIFRSGDPALAIRASLSLPLLFDPLPLDTLRLIDGGITGNIPVETARELGDVVVAVDASAPLQPVGDFARPWQIVDQVTTILEEESDARSLTAADIAVSLNLPGTTPVKATDLDSLMEIGRRAMRQQLPQLKVLLQPPTGGDNTFIPFDRISYCDADDRLPPFPGRWSAAGGAELGALRAFLRQLLERGWVADAWMVRERDTVTVEVQPNPAVNTLRFTGDRLLPDSTLQRLMRPAVGGPSDRDSLDAALNNLRRLFAETGYPAATMHTSGPDSAGLLTVNIDVGRLALIRFHGLRRTPRTWLEREIPLKPGEPVTRKGVTKGMSNLYATGLFRAVYPSLTSAGPGSRWILDVYVSEYPALPVRLGLAYQGERRTRGFVELVYPAAFWYAERLVAFVSVGERDEIHSLAYISDRSFGLPLTFQFTFHYRERERTAYDTAHRRMGGERESRWGLRFEAGGQAPSWGLLAMTTRIEQHHNDYLYLGRSQDYNMTAVGARLAVDTQDRTPFPRNGWRLNGAVETSPGYPATGEPFSKLWGDWAAYMTPLRRYTVGFRAFGGTADRTIPRDEQFRLGGMESFPGLHLDEAVGILQLGGGVETRYDLISRFLADTYVGMRFDVAGSWSDPEAQILRSDWMTCSTLYFAFDTFLGPLKLQWGHLFPAGPFEAQDVVFIQAGNMF